MSTLVIKCPKTGEPVSTGIETDEYSFNQFPDVLSHSHCPLCGIDHPWWTREAWLSGNSQQAIAARPQRGKPAEGAHRGARNSMHIRDSDLGAASEASHRHRSSDSAIETVVVAAPTVSGRTPGCRRF